MRMSRSLVLVGCLAAAAPTFAGSSVDAAVGGAVGGGLGALVGNEVGGRSGAIVGGALGAATGAAIATDNDHKRSHSYGRPSYGYGPPRRHCPPGLAMQGRCW
jgi:outer membrane lipoprotein SlyB